MAQITVFASIIFAVLALNSCSKEDTHPHPPLIHVPQKPIFTPCDTSTGAAYSYKLNNLWASGVTCRSFILSGKKYWIIDLETCDSYGGFQRENIIFGGIPDDNPIQKYKIKKISNSLSEGAVNSSFATFSDDGDVFEDYYYVDSSSVKKNYFQIEKWDKLSKRAEGSFNVLYEIREPQLNSQNPKKVIFSSGRFWVSLP